MANTLNIPERTLVQISDKTDTINIIGGVDGRKSALQPIVARITDHADNDAAETGADTDKMAIFVSKSHGHPWKKDVGTKHIVHDANTGAAPTDVTVLYPNHDYTTFN